MTVGIDDSDSANGAAEAPSGPPAHAPLQGVRVVDLTRHLPGPFTTRILADLGARVLKVEEPERGDPSRTMPPHVGPPGSQTGSLAALLLAGHASVALDLKQAAAIEAIHALLAEADVLVETFRPGTLARFGLAPDALRTRYPRLVICSISGYGSGDGQEGAQSGRAGHDLTYQALAGSLAARPVAPAVQVADIAGAWSAATAICAALLRRETTGVGCLIDQSLTDAAMHAAVTAWAAEGDGPKAVGHPLPLTGGLACYDVYPTKDGGFFALAMLEPRFWQRFCVAVERRTWVLRQFSSDPAFRRQVADLIASRTRDEWATLMAEHDLPGEPVLSADEARSRARNAGRTVVHDAEAGGHRLTYPARFDGRSLTPSEAVAMVGADTESVLAAHGLELPSPPKSGLRERLRQRLGHRFGRALRSLIGR